jgi:hypothetical protein
MPGGPFVRESLPLVGAMKELRAAWPARGWSWDGRLSCVSSSFSTELEGKARTAVALALTNEWTSTTLQRAPLPVRDLATRSGGLRAGQMIFAGDTLGAVFAYGLWWPWGDAMTTSLRIGLAGSHVTEDAFQRLREVFGAEI